MKSTAKPKPFAAFDIDGTLIRWQLYHAVADALAKLKYFNADEFDNVRQARFAWKQRDSDQAFKDYEKQLIKAYETTLQQLSVQQLDEAVDLVFKEYKDQVYIYTRDLIQELKQKGYLLFAISNSQTEIVEKIANYYGFDDCIGAAYGRKDNKFTGQKTVYLDNKDQVLEQLVQKHRASFKGSLAVGDSASDIPMLKLVEQPIAFNPEQKLFETAKSAGWQIVIERKNVIYRLGEHDGKYVLA